MDIILKYFPDITESQRAQFAALDELYHEWNSKINVISRKDIDALYEHHVLHSLAIAKTIKFRPGTKVLDLGTGGGFPGIPLAIMFPDTHFKLIDGTGKKILVVQEVAKAIGLKNCEAEHLRGENEAGKYDFVVSRAVMPLPDLTKLIKKNISKTQRNSLPNGLLCLKGGSIDMEIKQFKHIVDITELSQIFSEEWFKQKYLIYLPL
jgi:16S rRNA (guanine527-N7)-methyltransferase